jgi:hypothetical protein
LLGGGVSLNPNRAIDPLATATDMNASLGLDSTIGSRTDRTSVKKSDQFGSHGDNRIEKIDFEFECARDGAGALTEAKQAEFKDDVCQEITRLQKWAVDVDWIELPVTRLTIVVSDRYRISKSLVPAWSGRPGYMEFPTWRVASRRAAIMHELVHVFYPNGNRFLAEGLAVHLRGSIGGNPAFPNFGEPLHGVISGSFVQFLIETRGIDRFRSLYAQTPLIPLAGNVGSLDSWPDVYYVTLAELEYEWKSMVVSEFSMANYETFVET